jgi:hypothetical protein
VDAFYSFKALHSFIATRGILLHMGGLLIDYALTQYQHVLC